MGLFSDIGKVSEKVWSQMPLRDKIALITSPVPFLGTATGVFADSITMGEDPSALNAGFLASNFIPGARIARAIGKTGKGLFTKNPAKEQLEYLIKHSPNKLTKFYDEGKTPFTTQLKQIKSKAGGLFRGAGNLMQASYSPKAQARYAEHGISLTDQKVMEKALRVAEGTQKTPVVKKLTNSIRKNIFKKSEEVIDKAKVGKETMGQINQTRLFNEQYGNRNTIYNMLDGVDQSDFSKFSKVEYDKLMKAATGLNDDTTSAVFRAMAQNQGINDKKVWRMAIRRPYTGQASGNIRAPFIKSGTGKAFGNKPLNAVKMAFADKKPFGTNLQLLKALEKQNIRVMNDELVRKAAKEGRDDVEVILSGSWKSDAFELGGVNVVTVVKKDGNVVSFANDANNLAALKKIELNAPLADRIVSITPPMHFNVITEQIDPILKGPLDELADQSRKVRVDAIKKMGADPRKVKALPGMGLNKAQSEFVRRAVNAPISHSARKVGLTDAGVNIGHAIKRAANPIVGQMMERDDRRGLFPQ